MNCNGYYGALSGEFKDPGGLSFKGIIHGNLLAEVSWSKTFYIILILF